MSKRIFSRGGAMLAAIAFTAASLAGGASAASKYDLAKNLDEFDMQTVGMRVESTSDGGYIVAGKFIGCIKEAPAPRGRNDSAYESREILDFSECTKYSGITEDQYGIYDYCIDNTSDEELYYYPGDYPEVENDDDDLPRIVRCLDYVAKYDKNGKAIWMTPTVDYSTILTVGESSDSYMMYTYNNGIHTLDKETGEDSFTYLWEENVYNAKFNPDGSLILADHRGLYLYDKTAQPIRTLSYTSNDYSYDTFGASIISGGKIVTSRHNEETGATEIVEISDDLQSITVRLSSSDRNIVPVAGNDEGDLIVYDIEYLNNNDYILTIMSYDKNNQLIALIEDPKEVLYFLNGYVATNDTLIAEMHYGGFGGDDDASAPYLAMYSRELKEAARVTLSNAELVNDSTILNNGTLVTAGGIIGGSTSDENGLRIHLAAATNSGNSGSGQGAGATVNNPKTDDNIVKIALTGGIAMLGGIVLISRKLSRR